VYSGKLVTVCNYIRQFVNFGVIVEILTNKSSLQHWKEGTKATRKRAGSPTDFFI
jgi:hypothetical protein